MEVGGRGYRHRWREKKRGHRAKARNEQPCQRVSGEQQAKPNHAHQAKTGSLRMEARRSRAHAATPRLGGAAHAQHVRDRRVGISPTRQWCVGVSKALRFCRKALKKTPARLGHGIDQRSARRINEGAYRVVRESGCRWAARLVVRKEQRSSPDYTTVPTGPSFRHGEERQRSYPGRRAGPPTGSRIRATHVLRDEATKGVKARDSVQIRMGAKLCSTKNGGMRLRPS